MALNTATSTPILLPIGASKRFYETVLLLYCLNKVTPVGLPVGATSAEVSVAAENTKDALQCFIDKLGQICDSERGGDTVTAFAVLQYPDRMQYRFASNRRSREQLDGVRQYLEKILGMVYLSSSQARAGDNSEPPSRMMREVLSFNRPRVRHYIGMVVKHVDFCRTYCEQTGESQAIISGLTGVKTAAAACTKDLSNQAFATKCEILIRHIERLHNSPAWELIRRKAEENLSPGSCTQWTDLRHAAGRLLSYLVAVRTLGSAHRRWPRLFDNIEVRPLASSEPAKAPTVRRSANRIISRMTSKKTLAAKCQCRARELQEQNLDRVISEKAHPREFMPIVHAEVLVLDSLLNEERESTRDGYSAGGQVETDGESDYGDGGRSDSEDTAEPDVPASRFFQELRYIGCSKPTCLLCSHYFLAHPCGVKVRPSHENLYYNWRMPDIFAGQGAGIEETRNKVLEEMIVKVRERTFAALADGVRGRKKNDSHTDPTLPKGMTVLGGSTVWMAELETTMEQLDVEEEEEEDGGAHV